VSALFAAHPRAARDWGWLVIPMRWGFPVSESPGGGAIAHTDVGNISPEGPAFQPTWNRIGSADGWRQYDPEVLSVMLAPTTPWDKLKSGWGILNLPVGVFGFIPGWNVVGTQLMPWLSAGMHAVGAPPDRTFRPGRARLRFTSMSAGMSYQFGGREFASMLFDDSIPDKNISSPVQNGAAALRIGLQVYYGPKFSIENTYALSDHLLTAEYVVGGVSQHVTGEISTKDLTSGFRYDIMQQETSNMHVFLRGGWGWTSYHIDDVMVGTTPGDERKGGYMFTILPRREWWPNSWYGGVGAEFFAPRKAWLLPQAGWGLRTELTASRHRLGATEPGTKNRGIVSRYELGVAAVIGW
jgi:hypothetical protein